MTDGEHERLLRERRQAWLTSVLAGPGDEPYPVSGAHLEPRLVGDTLIVSGTVPSEADLADLRSEAQRLVGNGVSDVRLDVTVDPLANESEESGLLVQTLVATFSGETQAQFAADYLGSQGELEPVILAVLTKQSAGGDREMAEALHLVVPDDYWPDIEKALAQEQAVVIVTVDETSAFHAREVLEEETHSLQTLVLPPVTAQVLQPVKERLWPATVERTTDDPATIPGASARRGPEHKVG